MRSIIFICWIPLILSAALRDIYIDSDEDCWENKKDKTHDANLVKFSGKVAYGQGNCSVHLLNPWLPNIQNGFGVFLSRPMDCGSTVTVECLPDSILFNQTAPTSAHYTCHTSADRTEMSCSAIRLIYKRNIKINDVKKSTHVQVVALAQGPCMDEDVFFSCSRDYPQSCIDVTLQCNGRSECPNGEDERRCRAPESTGPPIIVIVLAVLAFLCLFCILSTVLVCFCCRAAVNRIARRFRSEKTNQSVEKGDITVTGEDAGLIKGLTGPSTVVEIAPQKYPEPAAVIIDSTKPIYPRLE